MKDACELFKKTKIASDKTFLKIFLEIKNFFNHFIKAYNSLPSDIFFF